LNTLGRQDTHYSGLLKSISEVPFDVVSMDFIFALPGQTIDDLIADVDLAFASGADCIAMYPFINFSSLGTSTFPLKERDKRKMLDRITEYLIQKGYVRTSLWTFSRDPLKKYSSMTRDNYLGFGCSAVTLLEKQFKINTFSVEAYNERIRSNRLPTALTLNFSKRQRALYYIFWKAYTMVIDPRDFQNFFGFSLYKKFFIEIWFCKLFGFVRKHGKKIVLTTKGAYYFHYYEQFYTLAYIDKMWGILKMEAFPQTLTLG
jgi:oxygen-independent coproporphyrinogen-3 oxidase